MDFLDQEANTHPTAKGFLTDLQSKNAYEAERKVFLDHHYDSSTPFQLNEDQQKAVFAIASGKYPEMPFVLHGPPGSAITIDQLRPVTLIRTE